MANRDVFLQPQSAERILLFGGIGLLIINMCLGEVFAIFVSHVANGEIKLRWMDLVTNARAGQLEALQTNFARIEFLLERRGRFINTHSHVGAFGILAFALAFLQPLLPFAEATKRRLASALIAGGFLQPLFIFVGAYRGSWAYWISDLGGLLIIVALAATIVGLFRSKVPSSTLRDSLVDSLDSVTSPLLIRAGGSLIFVGLVFGLYYAWVFTSNHEPTQFELVEIALASASSADPAQLITDYRRVQSRIGLTIAVHAHLIEGGILAILVALVQARVFMGAHWRRRWAWVLIAGAAFMPVCIYNAMLFGLFFAVFADLAGLLILMALIATLIGLVRHTGSVDAVDDPRARAA